jgi:hypothetical protein
MKCSVSILEQQQLIDGGIQRLGDVLTQAQRGLNFTFSKKIMVPRRTPTLEARFCWVMSSQAQQFNPT